MRLHVVLQKFKELIAPGKDDDHHVIICHNMISYEAPCGSSKVLKSWSHLETCSILGRYSPLSRTLLPCRAWSQLLGVCWMWLHLRWRSIRADPSSCGLDEQPRMPRNHSFCTHSQPTPRRWDSPELLDGLPEDPGTTSGSTRWLDWFAIDCFPRRRVRGTGRSGTLSGGWLLWGLGLKCGNEMTQGGGMGNGLVGVHVLRMEFACRDFHAHSRPQAEHQSFPEVRLLFIFAN